MSFEFMYWLLIVIGLIYLITRSAIFSPIRFALAYVLTPSNENDQYQITLRHWIRTLIYCSACSGFWIGVGAWTIWPYEGPWWAELLSSGIAAMAVGSLLPNVWNDYTTYHAEGHAWGDPQPEDDDDDAKAEEESEGSDGSD